jgi:hypothetical protein
MQDSKAKAAVYAAGTKWQWYLLRNPFYNATVSQSSSSVLFCACTALMETQVGKLASAAAEGTSGVPIIGSVVDMVTAPLLHVGKYYFHTSFS